MKYVNTSGISNKLKVFYSESNIKQKEIIKEAFAYFNSNGSISNGINSINPLISIASVLTKMAQNGLYESVLQSEGSSGLDTTYEIRFFADTSIWHTTAKKYGLTMSQLGIYREGGQWWHIGSYWVLPYNMMENTFPNNSDLENGIIALTIFAILLLLPYIPFLNKVPDKLKLYKVFWNRFTVPEIKNRKKNKRRR